MRSPFPTLLALALVAAAVAAAPPAVAGSAADPEAADPPGDTPPGMGFADLLAGWAHADNGTLLIGLEVADYQQQTPGACWAIAFTHNAKSFAALISAGQAGHAATVGPADGAGNATTADVAMGAPARILLTVPQTVVLAKPHDLVALGEIRSCYAGQVQTDGGGVAVPEEAPFAPPNPSRIDWMEGARTYSVPQPPAPPVVKTPPPATNTTEPPKNATETPPPATNLTTNLTGEDEDLAPSNASAQEAAPPADEGFLGLPGPAMMLVALAGAGVAALRRRA